MDTTWGIEDFDERISLRKQLFEPGGVCANSLQMYDDKLSESKSGWAANTDDMSIADLKLFTEVFALFSGNYDGIEKSVVMNYPNLLKYHDKVANDSRIKLHYSKVSTEDMRWTFLPGAFNQ